MGALLQKYGQCHGGSTVPMLMGLDTPLPHPCSLRNGTWPLSSRMAFSPPPPCLSGCPVGLDGPPFPSSCCILTLLSPLP